MRSGMASDDATLYVWTLDKFSQRLSKMRDIYQEPRYRSQGKDRKFTKTLKRRDEVGLDVPPNLGNQVKG